MKRLIIALLIAATTALGQASTEDCLRLMERESQWRQTHKADGFSIRDGKTEIEYRDLIIVIDGEVILPVYQQIRFEIVEGTTYLVLRGYDGKPDTRHKVLRIGKKPTK